MDSPGGGHSRWSWNKVPSRCVLVWESWARVRVVATLRAGGVEGEFPVEVWSLVTWCFRQGGGSCLNLLAAIPNICCRYASLYFCMCIDEEDNELEVLEIIHHFVEILDRYFGSVRIIVASLLLVCELDLIFNFHKAYYILDELLIAGELQESSKKTIARLIAAQ
ncbi:hypothetical protein V8G54_009260, partial [Vigna mungo]